MQPVIPTIQTPKHSQIKKCPIQKNNQNLSYASKFQILIVLINRSHKCLYEIHCTYDSDGKKSKSYINRRIRPSVRLTGPRNWINSRLLRQTRAVGPSPCLFWCCRLIVTAAPPAVTSTSLRRTEARPSLGRSVPAGTLGPVCSALPPPPPP